MGAPPPTMTTHQSQAVGPYLSISNPLLAHLLAYSTLIALLRRLAKRSNQNFTHCLPFHLYLYLFPLLSRFIRGMSEDSDIKSRHQKAGYLWKLPMSKCVPICSKIVAREAKNDLPRIRSARETCFVLPPPTYRCLPLLLVCRSYFLHLSCM